MAAGRHTATRRGAWRRGRRGLTLAAALAAGIAPLLLWRHAFHELGAALIVEDELAVSDVVVVSNSAAVPDAFEAAALYRDGLALRVLVPGSPMEPHLDAVRRLGIPHLSSTELVRAVLERSGVPATAIEIMPERTDGTESEASVITAFVDRQRPRRLLVVTPRNHSARTGWLLRHSMPAETQLIVRSPRDDPFAPDSWWHSRDETRELMMEYARWVNTLLGDLWR